MTHYIPCITLELRDFPDCPDPVTTGHACDACIDRIDHAIDRHHHLQRALAGIDRAITAEPGSSFAGPRIPLSHIRLDFDEISSYRRNAAGASAHDWVQTETGAEQAVRYARAVHRADEAHPTVAAVQKLHRVRCPECRRLTAVVRPPDWYKADTTIRCIAPACGWIATNPEALDIVADIETRGRLNDADLVMLELRAQRAAKQRQKKGAA